MLNIGEYGLSITIVSLAIFPSGFQITAFADDTDPLHFEPSNPGKYVMLVDGTLQPITSAEAIVVELGVISGSNDDLNLRTLLQSTQNASKNGSLLTNLTGFDDTLIMVISYATNGVITLTNGTLLGGQAGDNVTAQGRRKGNIYRFAFGNVVNTQDFGTTATSLITNLTSLI